MAIVAACRTKCPRDLKKTINVATSLHSFKVFSARRRAQLSSALHCIAGCKAYHVLVISHLCHESMTLRHLWKSWELLRTWLLVAIEHPASGWLSSVVKKNDPIRDVKVALCIPCSWLQGTVAECLVQVLVDLRWVEAAWSRFTSSKKQIHWWFPDTVWGDLPNGGV